MSSSVLFTRRLGRLSFVSATTMLIFHCVYASLVFDVTNKARLCPSDHAVHSGKDKTKS